MDSREIDNVEIEKAKAMMRYNRIRNVAKMLRALEVCVALTFLSWSSNRFPNAFKISGEYFTKISVPQLFNSRVAFLIGNAIVVVIYLLNRRNDAGVHNNNRGVAELCDEYVQNSVSGDRPVPEPILYEDKRIIQSENVDLKTKCDEFGAAIERASKEIRRFERTQSQKLRRELRVKPRLELRRSETVNLRSGNEKAIASSIGTMEDQSSEEFRRTIEEFIEQQRFLMQGKIREKIFE